jgi:hypothetical protein
MYPNLKGLNAVEIHNDLVAKLKGEAKSNNPATYYLRKPSYSSPKTPQPSGSPAPILNEWDEAILLALSEKLFAPVQYLARRTHLHPSTAYDHFMHKLGFKHFQFTKIRSSSKLTLPFSETKVSVSFPISSHPYPQLLLIK